MSDPDPVKIEETKTLSSDPDGAPAQVPSEPEPGEPEPAEAEPEGDAA